VSLSSLTIGLTLGELNGFQTLLVYVLLALFVITFAAFLFIEKQVTQPMIDLRLFANRLFSINLVTGFLTFMASAGTTILMPYYLQNVMGYTPQKTGLLMAVVPIALGIISPISGSLSDRFGTRPLTVIGLAFMLFGYILISTLQTDTSPLGYILRFLPIGIGAGIFQSPNNSEIMSSAPRESLGVASGLLSLTRTLGQTTGIAILGAIWTGLVFSRYLAPTGVLDATAAPGAIQVSALQTTLHLVAGGILVALILSIRALRMQKPALTSR